MMTLDQVRRELQDRKLTAVAKATGLHYQTVWRVASGNYEALSYETVKALSDYLQSGKERSDAQ